MNLFLLLPAFILIALIVGVTYFVTKLQSWKALPVQEQAAQACPHCQSSEVQESGLWGANSMERVFRCAACQQKRFRNDLPD